MTHLQFIKSNFEVLAEKDTSILYLAYGEMCAEINGVPFLCNSVEEFSPNNIKGFHNLFK